MYYENWTDKQIYFYVYWGIALNFFEWGRGYFICFLYCLLLLFIDLHIFGWVRRDFFLFFLNLISKSVMFLLYLNSCKIYLFKVIVLYLLYCFDEWKNYQVKTKDLHFFLSGFSFTWHSRFIRQQGKGEAILNFSRPLPPSSQILTLAGRLLQRAHLCKWLVAERKLVTFGFWAQIANH